MNAFTQRLIPIEVEEPIKTPPVLAGGEVRTIMVKVPALKDPETGEIYLGVEATEILDKAKARHMGVLAPQELAELRRRFGLTQKEIAEVFQIGEKTWSRWETGREVVSRSLNLMLRAAYEGKITLPWLKAMLSKSEPLKLEPQLYLTNYSWLNTVHYQTGFSSWWPQAMDNIQAATDLMVGSHISVLGGLQANQYAYGNVSVLGLSSPSAVLIGRSAATPVAMVGFCAINSLEIGAVRKALHASTATVAGNNEEMPLCA